MGIKLNNGIFETFGQIALLSKILLYNPMDVHFTKYYINQMVLSIVPHFRVIPKMADSAGVGFIRPVGGLDKSSPYR